MKSDEQIAADAAREIRETFLPMFAGVTAKPPKPVTPKYQKTRVRKGDYLLPSNDATILWRFTYEDEPGVWAIHRLALTIPELHETHGGDLPPGFLDWDSWVYEDGQYAKLADAVASVIK